MLEIEAEEAMNDDKILDEEGFAELWDSTTIKLT